MPHFNASQQEAIRARNRNILISAAAGSGKTTVMVEKIRETLIQDPEASISQFLVITFTKDAARNMKDKLRNLLEEASEAGSEPAARALGEIETATVSTIHSFCTQLLKEYNDNSGASMNPRVLKDAERKRMLDESFTDAAERLLGPESACSREDRQAVGALLSAFSAEDVRKMTQDLYGVLMGIPEPFDFLARIVESPPYDLWNREILTAAGLDVLGLEELLRQESELLRDPRALPAYEALAERDREIAEGFLASFRRAETAETKKALLESARSAFGKAPSLRGLDEEEKAWKDRINEVRDGIKHSTKGILATAARRLDAILDERNGELNAVIRRELRGLELLVRETASQYDRQKLDAGAIDYADMEQVAYRIMCDPDRRNELLAKYRYIYVDECQDVSGIQDAIIKSLTGPGHRLFMVGDIKQSIYGFRHAEPALFEQERRAYSDDAEADERRIFFMDNYRSCKSVVDAVNAVFREAMDGRITDMDYLPEDNLRCNLEGDSAPVDVVLVEKGEEDADRLEAQCEAAGRLILSLTAPGPGSGAAPAFRYRDIVILLSKARGTAGTVVEHLKKMHIPALFEGAADFFGLAEVKSFLSLLSAIDNLRNDDTLVGTLLNTPFLFSETDLAEIRLEKMEHVPFYEAFTLCAGRNEKPIDRKCRQVLDQLAAWRKVSEGMTVPDFIWWLMRETGIYASRGAYPDGRARQANLDALYQRALDGQSAGNMRLSDFVSEMRENREARISDGDDPPALGPGDDYVRVMTMHKSKGLEFPAVILMDLQKDLRRKRNDEKLRMNISSSGGALGLYLPAVQRPKHLIRDSQGKEAFDDRALRISISETTRLLYVAMTRAQRKLCLVGSFRNGDEKRWLNPTRAARIWQTRSMLDMIMPAVLARVPLPGEEETREDALWRLTRVSGKAIEEETGPEETEDGRIRRILSGGEPMRMYLPETAEPVPLKTSVTTLAHRIRPLSEEDSEETVADKRRTEDSVRTFRLGSAPRRPAFLEEEEEEKKPDAAVIGTATHRFIRLVRLEALRAESADIPRAVRQEMDRMKAEGILTGEEAGLIRLEGAVSFFRSDLGRRMLESGDVRREVPFTMQIRPRDPTLVQGVIDCAFREGGEWILIDYKTDRDTNPETFVPRHEVQMNWYRAALERLTRAPVREMWLFALRAGKAFPVRRFPVEAEAGRTPGFPPEQQDQEE